MNNSGSINTSKNPDLITYTVLIDGEAIPGEIQVLSAIVSNEVNRIPSATIVILDGDSATQDFSKSNEDLFVPGQPIEITAGYHSDEETIFKGIIIKHSVKVRSNTSNLIIGF